MSNNTTIYQGSFSILNADDTALYGFGDLYAQRNLEVVGASTLNQTSISTSDGAFLVSGSNAVNLSATGAASQFVVRNASLTIATSDAGSVLLSAVDKVSVSAAQFSLSSTSDSVISASDSNLTLSGKNVYLNAAGSVVWSAASDVTLSLLRGNLLLNTSDGSVRVVASSDISLAAVSGFNASAAKMSLSASSDSSIALSKGSLTLRSSDGAIALQSSSDISLRSTSLTTNTTGNTSINSSSSILLTSVSLAANATSDSLINVTGAALNLKTTTSGALNINSAGSALVAAGASSTLDLQAGAAGTINIGMNTSDVTINIGSALETVNVGNNLNVAGNTVVTGNLTVNGTTTTINTQTLLVTDNLIGLNNAPAIAGRDTGLLCSRFSTDVTSDAAAATGVSVDASDKSIRLAVGASAVDSAYNNWYLKVTSGLGIGQSRQILSYVGATRTATLTSDWAIVPSDAGAYGLYNRPNTALFYDESSDEWALGFTTDPSTSSTISIDGASQYGTLHVGSLIVESGISGGNNIQNQVLLPDNATTRVDIPATSRRGSYSIIVQSSDTSGACATFNACCRSSDVAGSISRITESRSVTNERIQIAYDANQKVQLYHATTKTGGTGANLVYNVLVTKYA